MLRGVVYGILILVLSAVAWLHLVGRIYLVTADIGRHIENGKLAVVEHHIITTNQYSSTNPDFPTICHHWGAGVVFYLVWTVFGFTGLSMFYAAVLLLTLALFTWTAARASSLRSALLAAVLALPLVGARIEIRPEGFTAFFLGLNFLLLYGQRSGWFGQRWLWIIPFVQLAWVNVHIMFILGLCLLGIFVVDAIVVEGFGCRFRQLAELTLASIVLSFLNPSGARGVFEPLNVFTAASYSALAENQSVFWMMQRFPTVLTYKYCVMLLAAAVVLVLLHAVVEANRRQTLLHVAVLGFFGVMAAQSVRSIATFGFFFIPIAAESWDHVIATLGNRWHALLLWGTGLAAATMIALAACAPAFFLCPLRRFTPFSSLVSVLSHPDLWSGLVPGAEGSAGFFKTAALRGPVFNNYDIGGYFIFEFYPQERPFIDNRPEAYPMDFLKDVYGPMQAEDSVWAEKEKQFGFQLILFYRHDMTEWGQRFLVHRISDPEWAPIFVDAYTLLLAKRGGINQAAIDRYELPRSLFMVKQNR